MTEPKEIVLDSEFFKDYFSASPKSLREAYVCLTDEKKKEFKAFENIIFKISNESDPHQLIYHKEVLGEYLRYKIPNELLRVMGKIFSTARCSKEVNFVQMREEDWRFFEQSCLSSKKYFIESADRCHRKRAVLSTNSFCNSIDDGCIVKLFSMRITFNPITVEQDLSDGTDDGYQ